jgi:putative transcriptional regulator
MASTAGRLLVAEPMLGDPNFDRAVVLMVSHTSDGALGLVLNRPTDAGLADALPAWAPLATTPEVVHIGGPVEAQSGWCLARALAPTDLDGFVPVVGDLGLLDLEADPGTLVDRVHRLRIYAGYSGWGPGQLDDELAADAWFVVDADPEDPFVADGGVLWNRILERQGGALARLSNFPTDPSLN